MLNCNNFECLCTKQNIKVAYNAKYGYLVGYGKRKDTLFFEDSEALAKFNSYYIDFKKEYLAVSSNSKP